MPFRQVNLSLISPFTSAAEGAVIVSGASSRLVASNTAVLQLNPEILSATIYASGYIRILGSDLDTNSNIFYGNGTVLVEFSNYNFVSNSNIQATYSGTLSGSYDITMYTPNGESTVSINAFSV